MKVGIIGLKLSGKTTIFNTLTGLKVQVGDFSSNKKSNIGVFKVPDNRVDELTKIFQPEKTIYAEINFSDLTSSQSEKATKEGFSAQLAAEMREAEAFSIVVRSFIDENVPHPKNTIDPLRDLKEIENELIITDQIVIEKRLEKAVKDKAAKAEVDVLQILLTHLEKEEPIRKVSLTDEQQKIIRGFRFLSQKPILIVNNISESQNQTADLTKFNEYCEKESFNCINILGKLEMELSQLPEDERAMFLQDYGIKETAQARYISASYKMMNLMSFFTVGKDEVRAWTINKNTKAVNAAGKIHSDIEKGFIRAEVVSYDDFIKAKTMVKAKETGKLRLEGKEYLVQDGDIIEFRFNV